MGKISCRLHLLANFGTDADKAVKTFENTESGTFRLIRTAAKGFTLRGCGKSGVWCSCVLGHILEGQSH